MFIMFVIGIIFGIYIDQEFETLPKIKPLFVQLVNNLKATVKTSEKGAKQTKKKNIIFHLEAGVILCCVSKKNKNEKL